MSQLDGKWKFTIVSMMGEQYALYDFHTDGEVLTGSAIDEATQEVTPMEPGTFDGKKFAFKITMKLPFGIMPFEISGELLEDDTLKGESAMPMGVSQFTAVRA